MSLLALDSAQAQLTVDLEALKSNWRRLAARATPAECGAVVKADAYGLGIERVVPALARAGCRTFFVAHLSEGVRARGALRDAGFADAATRVFLLHGLQPGALVPAACFSHALSPVLASRGDIEAWIRETAGKPGRPSVAIQVDTGMNRIGLDPDSIARLPFGAAAQAGATLLMSHFVSAEEPANPINVEQITAFDEWRRRVFPGLAATLCNSSGIFLPAKPHYNLVRPGYALYGGNPCPGRTNPMKPVLTLQAGILQTRMIEAGETVGYGGLWTAARPTRLATIGIGYADGVPRSAATLGTGEGPTALAGGVPCPLVGRISMDLSIVDVTDAAPDAVLPGAPIELLGPTIDIDTFARRCGTIGYEILTSLGRRYSRIYLENTA